MQHSQGSTVIPTQFVKINSQEYVILHRPPLWPSDKITALHATGVGFDPEMCRNLNLKKD